MKKLPIIQVGNQQFRLPCTAYADHDVTSKPLKELILQMKYTMRAVHGVGLAAPQIGVQKQLFVMRLTPTKFRPHIAAVKPYAVINPQVITRSAATTQDHEGCFSVAHAGLFAELVRPQRIQVAYFNEEGLRVTKVLQDLEARVFLHEYDHLHGSIFLDHSINTLTYMSAEEYRLMRQNV